MSRDDANFARAVELARRSMEIDRRIVREEFLTGHTIVRQPRHPDRYSVFPANAWERPVTPGFLPWSPPEGEPVADVALDGTVTMRNEPHE
ncbi:hypothetical protein [Micromonospora sp. NPDC005652]|uniref:hypothetical protein n=1 Tax=Micromonospora sp. NPDC005652 TaxID=3157046 RepID=UPI0033C9647B